MRTRAAMAARERTRVCVRVEFAREIEGKTAGPCAVGSGVMSFAWYSLPEGGHRLLIDGIARLLRSLGGERVGLRRLGSEERCTRLTLPRWFPRGNCPEAPDGSGADIDDDGQLRMELEP